MNASRIRHASRCSAASAGRFAATVTAAVLLATPAIVQSQPVFAASVPPAAVQHPLQPAPPGGAPTKAATVYPLRTLDAARLAMAKREASARTPLPPISAIPQAAPKTILYNGLNQPGIAALDEGACCTPPDTTGSIGPTRYVEIVNNLVRVYDRSLNRVSDMDLGTFTGTPSGLATSDPQMQWDPQGNRWFYDAVAFATGNNYLLLGWSKTADPSDLAGGWCHFGLSTANLLQDYPKLGHDNNYLMVGANEYDDSKAGEPFVTAVIWALPKPASGDTSCTAGKSTHFGDPTHLLTNADGSPAFTPIPVNTADSSTMGYIVAAHSPMNTPPGPQTKVMAWHMVKGGSGPQLVSDGDLTVKSFNIPPPIPQPGPTVDSLDARLTQAVGHKDPDAGNVEAVWTQHTVVSTTTRSVVRWYELIPSQHKVRQQGEISSATDYLFNAAISPSTLGNDAALFYNRANASLTPVIGAVSRTHTDPLNTMGSELLIGSSVAADQDLSCSAPYGPPCRWGDYSGASPDPNAAGIVWGSNQLNGAVFFGYPQWTSRNFAVAATVAPDFSLAVTPTGRAVNSGGSATYTVTVTDLGGFTGSVTLSASALPAGATALFSPNPTTTTSTLTVSTAGTTPAGTSQFNVTGVNGSLNHMVQGTLVVNSASTYASTIMADGPNAYWRVGETSGNVLVDSTANANNGIYAGGFTLNQSGAIIGDANGAVRFDGSTGNARVPNAPTLDLTGAITTEAWVKWTATATTAQNIINKGDGATAAGTSYHLAYVPGCTGCGLGLYTFIGNGFTCACQSSPLPAGQWFQLVGTRTATGQLAFYVNGALVASANDGGAALNNVTSGVGLGASGSGSSMSPLNGSIDEAAIYPTAFTAAQVAAHFQASGQASAPGAPGNVTATAGANQATVTWTTPAGNITGYIATAFAGSSAKNSIAVSGSTTSATLTGLLGGTAYTIQVRALNAIGSSPPATSNAATPTGAASTYVSAVLGDGPVMYQRLGDPSGTISPDSSGNGNAGTYAGGFTQNQPGALLNDPDSATLLDGSSGNVRTPTSTSLNITSALTVEAWVKWTTTASSAQNIVNKGDGATATGTSFQLAYAPGCPGCGLGFYTFIGGNYTCACQSSPLPAGQWFHLVGTRTATGLISFYVNGALAATANDGGGALNSVPSGIGVGASGSGSSMSPLNGTVDEAAVYPAALSAARVSNHFQAAGAAVPPAAPGNVTATAGANQATVTWTAPAGNITGYVATAFAGTSAKNSIALGGSATSATLTGLQGGTTYAIQVVALNAIGSSPPGTSNAVTPTGAASTYVSTVLGDGPVMYQRLGDPSGTISPDSSGNGNAGTYAGGFTQNQAGALLNDPDNATLLDGSSGNIRTPTSTSLNITGALTVEAWVKWTTTASSAQNIVNKGDGATATGTSFHLAYAPGCPGCGLGLYTFIGGNYTCACQSSPLPAGQWFHLVGTRTAAGLISFYVNGALVATANDGGGALNSVPSGVGVGASGSGTNMSPLNGTVDEAAVYPTALSAAQVSTHYHAAGY